VRAALGSGKRLGRAEKYRRLVQLVDEEVGRVLQELEHRHLTSNTVVVLLSDHGEGLGEDKRLPENHGKYLYNALTHVPLAIRLPGHAGRKISQPVSLLDVHPTLLELFTAPARPQPVHVDGGSLLPFLLAGTPAAFTNHVRPLPLNESDQFGVVVWPYKLLVRRRENLAELYDLRSDFAEKRDLSTHEPKRVAELLATYSALPRVEVDRTTRGRQKRERAAASGAHPLPPHR
jgi:arylsulfatase A-like enzyme